MDYGRLVLNSGIYSSSGEIVPNDSATGYSYGVDMTSWQSAGSRFLSRSSSATNVYRSDIATRQSGGGVLIDSSLLNDPGVYRSSGGIPQSDGRSLTISAFPKASGVYAGGDDAVGWSGLFSASPSATMGYRANAAIMQSNGTGLFVAASASATMGYRSDGTIHQSSGPLLVPSSWSAACGASYSEDEIAQSGTASLFASSFATARSGYSSSVATLQAEGMGSIRSAVRGSSVYRSDAITFDAGGAGMIGPTSFTVADRIGVILSETDGASSLITFQSCKGLVLQSSQIQLSDPVQEWMTRVVRNYWTEWHDSFHPSFPDPVPILSPRLWFPKLVRIFVAGARIFGDSLTAILNAQRAQSRAGIRQQSIYSTIVKALHKPLQVIPESIHPIDAAAYLGC